MLQEVIASRGKRVLPQRHNPLSEEGTPRPPKGSRMWAWVMVLLVAAVGVFGFSIVFSGAVVKVTPRIEAFSIDETFTAIRRNTDGAVVLPFDLLTLEETAQKEVPASGSEYIEKSASGIIVVYNKYSTKSQKFVNNTRFQSTDGKIFRIRKPITVPGKSTVNGEEVPGSVEVAVYAEEQGKEYNIGLADFTVPGLAGSPMYDGFFARSKTPIEGGFVGEVKKISVADREQATRELRDGIKTKLYNRVFEEKPEGFLLYDDGIFIAFEDGDAIGATADERGDTAVVSQKGTLQVFMFSEGSLSDTIARRVVDHFENRPVVIPELPSFRFTLLDKASILPSDTEEISFVLAGSGRVIWDIDASILQDALVEQPKKDFQKILSSFLGIERAEIVIRPFWKRTFPEKPAKIKIEMMIPEGN